MMKVYGVTVLYVREGRFSMKKFRCKNPCELLKKGLGLLDTKIFAPTGSSPF